MKDKERYAVIQKINELCIKYEYDWNTIDALMKHEVIEYDFYEDLYEILYHFPCDEQRLLARVFQLLEKQANPTIKNNQK